MCSGSHPPLFGNNCDNKQPQQLILGELRVWLLISYSITRSLEGYEAFGVIRAEEETDDSESTGARFHWIASYRGIRSGGPDLYHYLSIRNHFSGALPACSRFDLRWRNWNLDYL
jgi:hypothetical protein